MKALKEFWRGVRDVDFTLLGEMASVAVFWIFLFAVFLFAVFAVIAAARWLF